MKEGSIMNIGLVYSFNVFLSICLYVFFGEEKGKVLLSVTLNEIKLRYCHNVFLYIVL